MDFLLLMFRLSVSGPPTQHDETGQGSASDANIASDCTSQSFQLEIKLQSQAVSRWFVLEVILRWSAGELLDVGDIKLKDKKVRMGMWEDSELAGT